MNGDTKSSLCLSNGCSKLIAGSVGGFLLEAAHSFLHLPARRKPARKYSVATKHARQQTSHTRNLMELESTAVAVELDRLTLPIRFCQGSSYKTYGLTKFEEQQQFVFASSLVEHSAFCMPVCVHSVCRGNAAETMKSIVANAFTFLAVEYSSFPCNLFQCDLLKSFKN